MFKHKNIYTFLPISIYEWWQWWCIHDEYVTWIIKICIIEKVCCSFQILLHSFAWHKCHNEHEWLLAPIVWEEKPVSRSRRANIPLTAGEVTSYIGGRICRPTIKAENDEAEGLSIVLDGVVLLVYSVMACYSATLLLLITFALSGKWTLT